MQTRQEIFETVANHLFSQGQMATNGLGACSYRSDGLKCAVGVLIPDNEYREDFDNDPTGTSVKYLCQQFDYFQNKFGHDIYFFERLQGVHDNKHNWDSNIRMRDALKEVAIKYQLDHNFLETLSFKR